MDTCPYCAGHGIVKIEGTTLTVECSRCDGTGKVCACCGENPCACCGENPCDRVDGEES